MSKTIFCNRCKTCKLPSEFYRSSSGKLRAGCKACLRADSRKRNPDYQRTHAESNRAKVKRWAKKNPERIRGYARVGMRKLRRKRREAGTPALFELPQNSPAPRAAAGPPASPSSPSECSQPKPTKARKSNPKAP